MEIFKIRKRINSVCFAVLLFIAFVSALQLLPIMNFLSGIDVNDSVKESFESIYVGLSYVVSYVVTVLVYKRIFKMEYCSMNIAPHLGRCPIPMILASLGVIFTASHISGYFNFFESSSIFVRYENQSIVLLLFTSAIVPAFCEELFFRGLIMTNLMPLGKGFAIITSAIIFGLIHGNHDQILFATVAGLIFGWVYSETGTLWCGIIIHLLNNTIVVAQTVLAGTLEYTLATKISLVIQLSVFIFGAVSILYLIYKFKEENKVMLNKGCFGKTAVRLWGGETEYSISEYLRGLFAPAAILFAIYVIISEIVYVIS